MYGQQERPKAKCVRCGKTPAELPEYSKEMTESSLSPEDFVWAEEGTLNEDNGHFACTECYIAMGQPSAPFPGWKAP